MPFPPLAPSLPPSPPPVAVMQEARPQVTQVDQVLRVTWHTQRFFPDKQHILFLGGVFAEYEPTTIRCDELELWNDQSRGEARGQVVVTDPEGTLRCQNLQFNWKDNTAHAANVQVEMGRLRFDAGMFEMKNGEWLFSDLKFTTSKLRRPDLALAGESVRVVPGKSVLIRKPVFTILGKRIAIPTSLPVSLDRRVEGLRMPTLAFRKGHGVGVSWLSGFILSEHLSPPRTSTLSVDLGIFPAALPGYSLTWVQSTQKPTADTGLIKPVNELEERFRNSPMESIQARSFSSEFKQFRTPRTTYAAGLAINQNTTQRKGEDKAVSKLLEVTGEWVRTFPYGNFFAQVRLHDIRVGSAGTFRPRLYKSATLLTKPVLLGPLEFRARADSLGTIGAKSDGFGWLRGAASLSSQVAPGIRLSTQFDQGTEWGTPAFEMDRLYRRHGWSNRVDLQRGPMTAGLMFKYDFDHRKWVDTEWSVAWISGSYEPFIASRLSPRGLVFGIRVRYDDLANRLAARSVERGKTEKPRN